MHRQPITIVDASIRETLWLSTNLAMLFHMGLGPKGDTEAARVWQRAAEQGPVAQFNLRAAYQSGQAWGTIDSETVHCV